MDSYQKKGNEEEAKSAEEGKEREYAEAKSTEFYQRANRAVANIKVRKSRI